MKTPIELFGVECGKGWYSLIEPLIAQCKVEGASISQIKEKFGGLRFYVYGASDELRAAIDKAEAESFSICEECGRPGRRRNDGWIRTLCDKHAGEEEGLMDGYTVELREPDGAETPSDPLTTIRYKGANDGCQR